MFVSVGFFFFFVNVCLAPRTSFSVIAGLPFFFGGRARRDALTVKGAVEAGRRNHDCFGARRGISAGSEALERHRQQVWKLIVSCSVIGELNKLKIESTGVLIPRNIQRCFNCGEISA